MAPRRAIRRKPTIRPEEIVSFKAAEQYLNAHINLERISNISRNRNPFKLDRINRILDLLDNPQNDLRHVHIAGTKGKGSTVAMLQACLSASGFTVGTFTSPHLIDICERIQINGVNIAKQDFASAMREVAAAVESDGADEPPHFFEILTALAFHYFASKAVGICVIEVGLGGRLDCTNVILPECSAITQISIDHTNVLGNSLRSIAREKAGILKRGVPAVSAPQQPEVEDVLRSEANRIGTQILFLENEIEFSHRFQAVDDKGPHTRICVEFPESAFEHVVVPLPGEHQACNCALALSVVQCLRRRGFHLDPEKIIAGLVATRIQGRMEMLADHPRLLIDGAHNAASLQALFKAVGRHIRPDSIVVIFGCNTDKDIDGMLTTLARAADKVIFTRSKGNPRVAMPVDLAEKYDECGGHIAQTAENLTDALDIAVRAVGSSDLVVVTGSFFLVGEARKMLQNRFDIADQKEAELTIVRSPVERLASLCRKRRL